MTDAGHRITTAIRGHLASTTATRDTARALASDRVAVGENGAAAGIPIPAAAPDKQKG